MRKEGRHRAGIGRQGRLPGSPPGGCFKSALMTERYTSNGFASLSGLPETAAGDLMTRVPRKPGQALTGQREGGAIDRLSSTPCRRSRRWIGSLPLYRVHPMPREEANGRDRAGFKPMKTHNEVIENFILEGVGGKGTYVKASDDLLISRVPESFAPFGHRPWRSAAGTEAPLAVRLKDGGILAN